MAFKAPQGGGDRVEQPALEADVYRARLVQVITLGLQPQKEFQGVAKKPCQEVMLTYELCDEFMKDEDGEDIEDKPRWVSETIPFHPLFAENAKSTKRLKAFDPEDHFDGDISKCVDIPVNVTLVINKKGDKVYTNIASIAPMSAKKAASCPELKNPVKLFDIDEPDAEMYKALPKWIQEKMQANLNYKGSPLEAIVGGKAEAAPKKEPAADADENPY